MADVDLWPIIRTERAALAENLQGLSEEQWETPSLCEGWTVREVLAHLTATAKVTAPGFFVNMITSGFRLGRMQDRQIAIEKGDTGAEALRRFESTIRSRNHPPGPSERWLGETLVHAEDIRRPLGIVHDYPLDAAVRAASFYEGSDMLVGAKTRVLGLQLRATDIDWSTGEGPLVEGPIMSLVLAMTGRSVALDDLSGDGVEVLRERP